MLLFDIAFVGLVSDGGLLSCAGLVFIILGLGCLVLVVGGWFDRFVVLGFGLLLILVCDLRLIVLGCFGWHTMLSSRLLWLLDCGLIASVRVWVLDVCVGLLWWVCFIRI